MRSLLLQQGVIDLLPVAIYVCSAPEGRIVQFNRTAVQMWGREPLLDCDADRYCGSFKVRTSDGVHIPHDNIPMAWVLTTGNPVRGFNGIVERPDGTFVRVVVNIDPIRSQAGEIIGAINVFQDVTKLIETEASLHAKETQLKQFIDSGLFGVQYWTVEGMGGEITDANEAFAAMTGYTRDEMRAGKVRWEEITPPGHEETEKRAVEQILTAGVQTPYEKEFLAKDGRRVPVLMQGAMLDRKAQSGMSLVIDLSELHAARERAQQLETQLFHAQKMDAVGQLAGAVAHDFNNLLMVISSQAELLLEATDPSKIEKRAKQILYATESAGVLTKKLLAFGRKQDLATSTFDLNQLVSETTEFIGRLISKSVEVDVRLYSAPCWVSADRAQMEQMLINLVLNARDAMPDGGKLVISTSSLLIDENNPGQHFDLSPGEYALISIADTGLGIPKENIGRVFEPFFTTKPKERGTGLGLAIVYGIVTHSGGHIRVASTVGAGTTFSIYLPSAKRLRPSVPEPHECPIEVSPGASCPCRGLVLVVDDEEFVRTGVRSFLEENGLSVIDTGDPCDALEIARNLQRPLSVLVTDVVMPGMTGIELAHLLVNDRPDLPIVFMSGYAAGESGHEDFSHAKFLQKPFARAKLL